MQGLAYITHLFSFGESSLYSWCVLSTDMDQPQVYTCPRPLSLPPTPLGSHRAGLSSLCLQQLSTRCLSHTRWRACFHPTFSVHPTLSSALCPQVWSLHLHLHSSPADSFISTVFLDSIYMHWYTIFVFLFLIYFTLYNRIWVHPPH